MKNITLIMAALLLPLFSYAQRPEFIKLYDKYSGKEDFTTVAMSGDMFRAIKSSTLKDSGKNNIKHLVIIVAETDLRSFSKDVKQMITEGSWNMLSTVRSDQERVEFYMVEGPETYREFLMTIQEEDEYVVILITGDGLDINTIYNITGNGLRF